MDGRGPTRTRTNPRDFLCAGALVDHSDRNRSAPFENPYFAVPGVRTHWLRRDGRTRETESHRHSKQVCASRIRADRTNSTRALTRVDFYCLLSTDTLETLVLREPDSRIAPQGSCGDARLTRWLRTFDESQPGP